MRNPGSFDTDTPTGHPAPMGAKTLQRSGRLHPVDQRKRRYRRQLRRQERAAWRAELLTQE